MDLKSKIRDIPDFPHEGIIFKDITTLLKDKEAFRYVIKTIADKYRDMEIDFVAGPEARGFIIGASLAYELGTGFVPIRKEGKLPAETIKVEYDLEYGKDSLEIHRDSIEPGQKILMVDDLLATGGTISSACKLVEKLGGEILAVEFIIELEFLNGRKALSKYNINSLIQY